MKKEDFNQLKDSGVYKSVEKALFSDPTKTDVFKAIDQDPLYIEPNEKVAKLKAALEELEAMEAIRSIFNESDMPEDSIETDASVDDEGKVEAISTTPDEDLSDESGASEIGVVHIDVPDDVDPTDIKVTIDDKEFVVGNEDAELDVDTKVDDIEAPVLSVKLPDDVDPGDVSVNIDGKEYVIDAGSEEPSGEDESGVGSVDIDSYIDDEDKAADIEEIFNVYKKAQSKKSKKFAETLAKFGLKESDLEGADDEDNDDDLEVKDEEVEEKSEEKESGEDVEELKDVETDEEIEEIFNVYKKSRANVLAKFGLKESDLEGADVDETGEDALTDDEVKEEIKDAEEEADKAEAEAGEAEEAAGEAEEELTPEESGAVEEAYKMINHHLNYRYGGKWKIYEDEVPEGSVVEEPAMETYDLEPVEDAAKEDEILVDDDTEEKVEEVVSSNGENSEEMPSEELEDVAESTKIGNILNRFLNESDVPSYLNYGPNAGISADVVGGPSRVKTNDVDHPAKTHTALDDSKYYGGRGNVKVQAGNSASRADMSDVTENLMKAMGKAGSMKPTGQYTVENDSRFVIYTNDLNQAIKPLAEVSTHKNNLPLAENVTDWNARKAASFIKEAAYKNPHKANLKLMKATHLYFINEGKNPEDYQFPIATVIKGKVYAVPQAIEEAARLFASPIYTKKFNEATLKQIRTSIDFYMNKMGKETPWQNGTCVNIAEGTNLTTLIRKSVWDPYKLAEAAYMKDKERKAKELLS